MESCLLNFFIFNDELKSTCDFNPFIFESSKAVYEVLRVENEIPVFLKDHIERFYNSGKIGNINITVSKRQITKRIKALIESNKLKTGLIKFIFLTHNDLGELFAAWITPFYFPTKIQYSKGIEMISLKGLRELPNAKFTNLSVRKQADKIIKEKNIYEVLLINNDNIITEGSRSNIFFIKNNNNTLFTPDKNLVLNGITRKKIISLAKDSAIEVNEGIINYKQLKFFDAAFITGTSPKVLPVNKIDSFNFDVNNTLLLFFKEKYNHLINDYLNNFSWDIN
jgi:branched-chain amino acid aminotransferase